MGRILTTDGWTDVLDLALVAISGDYDDLTGKPTLGTAAAAAVEDFDAAGAADTAVAGEATARDTAIGVAVAALSSVYQPLDSDLTAIALLSTTTYGRAFLALADAAAARTALALGTAATSATSDFDASGAAATAQAAAVQRANHTGTQLASTISDFNTAVRLNTLNQMATPTADIPMATFKITGLGDATAALHALNRQTGDARYQPLDSDLTAIAALTTTTYGRALLALADAAAARTALALGTLATQSGTFSGTSSGTNTGDQDLSGYAPLASPTLTGDPKAPTPAVGDNDTSIATTAFVNANGSGGGLYGDGSDGSVTFNGVAANASFSSLAGSTYTLSRDVFATDMSISTTVVIATNGFRLYATGTLTGAGTAVIRMNGTAGGGGTNNSNGGGGATASGTSSIAGGGGTNILASGGGTPSTAGAGVAGTNISGTAVLGGTGGTGGTGSGGAGAAGGTASAPTSQHIWRTSSLFTTGAIFNYGNTGTPALLLMHGGSGGGSGGGDGTNRGGGGGGGGGVVMIAAKRMAGAGAVECKGGAGSTPTTGNTGGGGGGGGGFIGVASTSVVSGAVSGWTFTVTGGGGAAGTGTGTAGAAGADGRTLLLPT